MKRFRRAATPRLMVCAVSLNGKGERPSEPEREEPAPPVVDEQALLKDVAADQGLDALRLVEGRPEDQGFLEVHLDLLAGQRPTDMVAESLRRASPGRGGRDLDLVERVDAQRG